MPKKSISYLYVSSRDGASSLSNNSTNIHAACGFAEPHFKFIHGGGVILLRYLYGVLLREIHFLHFQLLHFILNLPKKGLLGRAERSATEF